MNKEHASPSQPNTAATSARSGAPTGSMPVWAQGDDRFWPEPGRTSPPPVSSPEIDFTTPKDPAPQQMPPRGGRRGGRRKGGLPDMIRWILPVIALAVVAALGGIHLWRSNSPMTEPPPASQGANRVLNRPAPPGWTPELAWHQNIATTPAVSVLMNRVAFVQDGRLTVVDGDSGSEEFISPPLQLSPNAVPVISRIAGRPVVGVQDGSVLTLWPLPSPNGAAGTRITLPLNAHVFGQSGGLLVSTGNGSWRLTKELELEPLNLPGQHVALGVNGDGELLSAPLENSWTFTDREDHSRQVEIIDKPEGTVGGMKIAWSSRGVVAAWGEMRDRSRRTVGLYSADTGDLLAQGRLSAQQVADGMPLTVSEHATHAAAGPLLADLQTGDVQVVPGWSTVMSNDVGMYGTVNGTRQFWTAKSGVTELRPGTGVPWGVSNSGLAIVVDTNTDGSFAIGGLRPDPNHPR